MPKSSTGGIKNSLNAECRHYFENIVKASSQMGYLIDDLLKFSRLGRTTIKSENVPPLIDVGAEVKDQPVVVSVADKGIGIAPEYHEKIFNIFQRLHNQAEYPGTGIGLAAVKKVVQIMGGQIWVESEPGKGSVFKVRLLMAKTE